MPFNNKKILFFTQNMNKSNSFDVAYQYQSETDVFWLQLYITGKIMTIKFND
jgi:hypothetical protein